MITATMIWVVLIAICVLDSFAYSLCSYSRQSL